MAGADLDGARAWHAHERFPKSTRWLGVEGGGAGQGWHESARWGHRQAVHANSIHEDRSGWKTQACRERETHRLA